VHAIYGIKLCGELRVSCYSISIFHKLYEQRVRIKWLAVRIDECLRVSVLALPDSLSLCPSQPEIRRYITAEHIHLYARLSHRRTLNYAYPVRRI